MARILVYRFSAMGDVVMLLPVLKGVLEANNDIEIFLLTQKSFFPFFSGIERLQLIPVDLKKEHNNFIGLFRLFNHLKKTLNPDIVIDLHCVIRTLFLDFLFTLWGFRVEKFVKGTFEKKKIVKLKKFKTLPNTIDRYGNVFKKLGLQYVLPKPTLFSKIPVSSTFNSVFTNKLIVGIAPFAKHHQKIWGLGKIEELIVRINSTYKCDILLFGGGNEIELLNKLSAKYSNCIVASDFFKLEDEIQVIHQLSVMVSMDSANMHIASMAGIPTISIWGATHPSLGFAPYNQPNENIMQYNGDQLTCRPCSVYGSKKCKYGDDIRCMNYVSVKDVFNRMREILDNA